MRFASGDGIAALVWGQGWGGE